MEHNEDNTNENEVQCTEENNIDNNNNEIIQEEQHYEEENENDNNVEEEDENETFEITNEIDLSIEKIVCFTNELIHATFSDNTAIVVHPTFEYFTYFHSNNTKLEMKSEFAIKQNSIDSKMNLLLSVYNLFSPNISPLTIQYVQENNLNCDKVTVPCQLEYIYWMVEPRYFEKHPIEYYLFNSMDYNTKIFLFKNLRVIKVEYLQPFNLQTNTYIKICKFYTINNIDKYWITPLILLMNYYNLQDITTTNQDLINWDIDKHYIVKNEYRTEMPKHVHVYNNNSDEKHLHLCNINRDVQINPIVFVYHKKLSVNFLYTKNYTYITNWNDNEIDIINNEFPFMNIYTKNKNELLVYWDELDKIDKKKSIHINTYAKVYNDSVNINKTLKQNENTYSDCYAEICNEIINLKEYGNINTKLQLVNRNKQLKLNNQNVTNEIPEFVFHANETHTYKEVKGVGDFIAYKSKSVKAIFKDRTIVRMNNDVYWINVFTKKGENVVIPLSHIRKDNEIYPYVKMTIDFYDSCFDNAMKCNEMRIQEEINYKIQKSIERIEDAEKVIFKKKKMYSDNFIYNKQPTQMDIETLLKRNEESLKEIRALKYNGNYP